MRDFADFILGLEADLPVEHRERGVAVGVTGVELVLPVETRLGPSGLELTAPRGRMRTGFDVAHGRVRLNFERRLAGERDRAGASE